MEEEERKTAVADIDDGDDLKKRRWSSSWTRRKRPLVAEATLDILLVVFSLANFALKPAGAAIGCFVCASVNGSNSECEDTFNSTILTSIHGSVGLYQHPCWAFRKNRKGLFPADHCIKVSGHREGNLNHTVLIRTCALDSGSLTADTEIVRISHCGHFKYEGFHYNGCVASCDSDGCNTSRKNVITSQLILLLCCSSLLLTLFFFLSRSCHIHRPMILTQPNEKIYLQQLTHY